MKGAIHKNNRVMRDITPFRPKCIDGSNLSYQCLTNLVPLAWIYTSKFYFVALARIIRGEISGLNKF